jgi:hypothetical protein
MRWEWLRRWLRLHPEDGDRAKTRQLQRRRDRLALRLRYIDAATQVLGRIEDSDGETERGRGSAAHRDRFGV